jgi:hypothetical protein
MAAIIASTIAGGSGMAAIKATDFAVLDFSAPEIFRSRPGSIVTGYGVR